MVLGSTGLRGLGCASFMLVFASTNIFIFSVEMRTCANAISHRVHFDRESQIINRRNLDGQVGQRLTPQGTDVSTCNLPKAQENALTNSREESL